MNAGTPSTEVARELVEYARSVDMRPPFHNAMLGERGMGLDCFEMVHGEHGREFVDALVHGFSHNGTRFGIYGWLSHLYCTPVGGPLLRSDQATYLWAMRQLIEIADEAKPRAREPRLEELTVPPTALICRALTPEVGGSADRRDEAIARLNLFEIALAAEIFHAERREWPFDLQQLQDTLSYDLPEDPFAGAAYHYRREPGGFVAWSLGKDLDDDGGHGPYDPGRSWDDCDIVWRVAR